jgi:hypothetical protein
MPATAEQTQWVERVLGVGVPGDETEPDVPDEAADYAPYLRKQLNTLRTAGSAGFGVVLGKQPDAHRLALHRTKAPRGLGAELTRQTGLQQASWGTAEPHPDKAGTMLLHLEGKNLPGLRKKTERMLKAFRPQPFQRVLLMEGAAPAEDLADPDDDAGLPPGLAGLPETPPDPTPQSQAFAAAAESGALFCEECPAQPEAPA